MSAKVVRQDSAPRRPEEGAEAYERLIDIHSRMQQMRLAHQLASKNICTVAGSFSSGKSSFLNALIGGENLLPTKITPTTSIPTYISYADGQVSINLFNQRGGGYKIDKKTLQEMTHHFKKKYGIDLNQIVERVVIATPHLGHWKRIAFIDTPGYTNPGEGHDSEYRDEEIARRQVLSSRFLIWLVDCASGTLPQEDVEFIKEHARRYSSGHKASVFIVLNKADKHLPDDRTRIMKEVAATAKRHGIAYAGIGLYSARKNRWYDPNRSDSGKTSFKKFLGKIGRAPASIGLDREVESIFDGYIQYHQGEVKRSTDTRGLMNRLKFLMDDDEDGNLAQALRRHCNDLEDNWKTHKRYASTAHSLQQRFVASVQEFMAAIDSAGKPNEVSVFGPMWKRRTQ